MNYSFRLANPVDSGRTLLRGHRQSATADRREREAARGTAVPARACADDLAREVRPGDARTRDLAARHDGTLGPLVTRRAAPGIAPAPVTPRPGWPPPLPRPP
ncbi:hypothetical protein [Streptomyces sp. MAA16]|uniref:hypothetical protein n=1 Tax=Streptomyces sp. MAA16 TaxID=3035116 RepID=UPI002476472D|nr:hypothetical protein [Streptomyces sp. MAA16]MDH6698566.1 hypothetical protein [Streptomyces sp. MAA16]